MATLLLVLIYIAFISLGLPDALLGAGWPVMQPEFAVPVGYAGLVQITVSVGTIISSIYSGRVLRRYGTGRTTAISVTFTAFALFGFGISPSFMWLLVAAIPLGLGAGSVDAGLNAYVAAHYESRHMSWLHSFWGLGALSGPLVLASLLARGMPWRKGYLSIAIFQSVLVIILFMALPLWRTVHRDVDQPKRIANEKHRHKSIGEIVRIKGVPSALLTFIVYTGIESTMGLWGGSYLFRTKGLDAVAAASWVSLFYASLTLGRIFNGFATYRWSNNSLIRGGVVVIFVGIVFLLFPLSLSFTLIGFLLVGFGCAPIFPSMQHATPEHFGLENSQDIIGLQLAATYTGFLILPPFFGFIAEQFSFDLMPFILCAYLVVLFISTERLRKVNVSNEILM